MTQTVSLIVGINWGDEGKGRMVDYLTDRFDVVVRYQGGGNAGHTVVNDKGKFALHLLPSGIFREGVVNILGNGVALDCENLYNEIETLRTAGVAITPENLKVSERASLLLPWHRELDALEEARLKDKKYGSTKQGIAPFYSDKYQKKTVLAGELLHPEHLKAHLADLLEWKNLTLTRVYGANGYTMDELTAWIDDFGAKIRPFVANTTAFLREAQANGKRILFEAQLGALRDLDYGIYPYTTSSNAIAAYAPVGSGLPTAKLDEVVGVVKAYSSCVGEGPFTCEWFGDEAAKLREAGAEFGPAASAPSTSWRRATAWRCRVRRASPSRSSTCSATWTRSLCAPTMRSTACRPTISPSPSSSTAPSPSWSICPAGSATSPAPAAGRICPRPRAATSNMWKRPSAVPSAMSPSARKEKASFSDKKNGTAAPFHFLSGGQAADFSVQ